MTHCQRRPVPAEVDPEELCWSHLAVPHPFPDTLAADRMASALAALSVSKVSESVAAAVAAAG